MFGNEFSRRICQWRPKIHSSPQKGILLILGGGGQRKKNWQKIRRVFFFQRRQMKCRESSEARFDKVWPWLEHCTAGNGGTQYFSKASGELGKAGCRFFSGLGLSLGIGIVFVFPFPEGACPPGERQKKPMPRPRLRPRPLKIYTQLSPTHPVQTIIIVNEAVDVDGKNWI